MLFSPAETAAASLVALTNSAGDSVPAPSLAPYADGRFC
jgi:hypothetical protein